MPAPVGTPVDVAFGAAIMSIGAAALLLFGNGFDAGTDGRSRRKKGIGLPGAPNARRARDKDGNPTDGGLQPPQKGKDSK